MSQQSITFKDLVTYIFFIGAVAFSVFELAVAGGLITIQQTTGFFSNLTAGGANWYLNPIPWVLILVVLVDIYGFAENYSTNPQQWNIQMFAATWFKYVPFFVIFSQVPWGYFIPGLPSSLLVQTNLGISAAITAAIDIISRALKAYNNNTSLVASLQAQLADLQTKLAATSSTTQKPSASSSQPT
jgi:hypothetical protein